MKNILYVWILVMISTSCNNDLVIPQPTIENQDDYDEHPLHNTYLQVLSNYRDNNNAPGSVLLVAKPDEPLWIGAVGKSNLAHQSAMSVNQKFRVGSITKMFTAVVILRLAEEGKLSLEGKLSELLPDLKGIIPQSDQITIRHLLAHQSGIFDPPNESLRYQGDLINHPEQLEQMSQREILETYVSGKPLHFSPGSAYAYSNSNYWLLGLIAEEVENQSMQSLMGKYIFDPLMLENTYLEIRDDPSVARGYADLYTNGTLFDVTMLDRAEGNGKADGGLVSNAHDLFRFMTGLFQGELISEQSLAEMTRIQLANCDNPYCEYGLGIEFWQTEAGAAWGHNGGLVGIEANVLYFIESGSVLVIYKNEGSPSLKKEVEALFK